jgi:hypothetical protein
MKLHLFSTMVLILVFTPYVRGQQDGRAPIHIFPQFTDGRSSDGSYYRSTVMASNPSSILGSSCTVSAYIAGLSSPLSAMYTFQPNQWLLDPTPGTAPFRSGYLTLSCTQPINASLVYSFYSAQGVKLGEATVFSSVPGRVTQILADQTGGARLGLAIVNDNSVDVVASILVGDTSGQLAASRTHNIRAKTNLAGFLSELTGFQGSQGQVLIGCDDSPCASIGLRYSGQVFTTIPSTVRIQ